MPCRCDYMEPTPEERRRELAGRLEQVKDWDLSDISDYLTEVEQYDPAEVKDMVAEYRQWVREGILAGSFETPTETLDPVLHAHIVHTEDFAEFRSKIGYLDHAPEVDMEEDPTRAAIQLVRYANYLGVDADALESTVLTTSGALTKDWNFLAEYLASDECYEFDVTKEEALKLVFEYLEYMHGKTGSPSDDALNVHERHLLFTEDYKRFCYKQFGEFIHYKPEL